MNNLAEYDKQSELRYYCLKVIEQSNTLKKQTAAIKKTQQSVNDMSRQLGELSRVMNRWPSANAATRTSATQKQST